MFVARERLQSVSGAGGEVAGLDAAQTVLAVLQSTGMVFGMQPSPVTTTLLSAAILLFSPYLYLCCLQGAAVAYFTAIAAGVETAPEAREQV